jgi:GTP-binding protein
MGEYLLKILILGRPNVGKSTFFNRLVGRKLAIVHDQPGVTRDWKEGKGKLADLEFMLYDTPGLEGFEEPELKKQIIYQTDKLIEKADILLLIVDARAGITKSDEVLAQQLRAVGKPIIMIANKCEKKDSLHSLYEVYQLGLGEPIAFSAEHGEGMDDLYQVLLPYFQRIKDLEPPLFPSVDMSTLRLAIIGRPNVGKSTLINALLGEERVLTGNQAGITRDAVSVSWRYREQEIKLIDTAGLRRRSRVQSSLEKFSVRSSLEEICYAHVVILVLDAHDPLNKQDLTIASHVIEEGRALVIALNKWDNADHSEWHNITHKLGQSLSQVKGVPIIPISALKKRNLDKLMKAVLEVYKLWGYRIPTAQLNQWLASALDRHPPPLSGNTRVKIKYATQVKTRPPTFALFVSKPVELPDSYLRYLMTSLREVFNLPSVPLRFLLRKGKNPFQGDKK